MGSLFTVVSREPAWRRAERLKAMAERSAYRGRLGLAHLPNCSIGVQARRDDSSLHDGDAVVVACHGRIYDPEVFDAAVQGPSAAGRLAQYWADRGPDCLRQLDGDFSAFVYDRRTSIGYLCVSLSMARPLYFTKRPGLVVVATEVRQVAAGAETDQRLDLERVVESLIAGGPVSAPHRTEYRGIDRLLAPNLYRIETNDPDLRVDCAYWTPPPTEGLTLRDTRQASEELLQLLAETTDTLPGRTAFSLSQGYDSGALWAVAHRQGAPQRQILGYTILPAAAGCDAGVALSRLLAQTSSSATVIHVEESDATAGVPGHSRFVDRIPCVPTLYTMDLLGERAHAAGAACYVLGFGAEAWASAPAQYGADLLRRGQWVELAQDALRFRFYSQRHAPRAVHGVRFMRIACAPPGSTLSRLRGHLRRAPPWLHARWHDALQESREAFARLLVREGYERGRKWLALRYYAVGTGVERVEQLGERYGLELATPYMRRRLVEFGFRTPGRVLADGRHPKRLLRRCAALALQEDPPWSERKQVDHVQPNSRDLVQDLGDPRTWALVDAGVVREEYLQALAQAQAQARALTYAHIDLSFKERYARQYGFAR